MPTDPLTIALPSGALIRCRALLFDMDGVLVDSLPTIMQHLRDWALRHGLEPERVIELSHGRNNVELIQTAAPFLDAQQEARRMQQREIDEVGGLVGCTGARELLLALPWDAWAVVTSGYAPVARARLRATRMPIPDVLVTASDVQAGKPDPEGYLTAAARLDVPPEECVVFEDAPAGVAAAHAGGMRVVGIKGTVDAQVLDTEHTVANLGAVRLLLGDGVVN